MGAEYSQMDQLSYPEAATLIKKYHGKGKRKYPVNKAQIKGMKNIPYARYVPLSDRNTDEYKSLMHTPKPRRKTNTPDPYERSKSSMPAPGRNSAAEVAFIRTASIRKSTKHRAKTAFTPQNEKELALSKIYIKPSDLVIEQPRGKKKKAPKKSSDEKGEKEKKKRSPFFKVKKKNQVQPSAVYIEPGNNTKRPKKDKNNLNTLPRLRRELSIRSRPGTQGSRPSTRGSIRRRPDSSANVSLISFGSVRKSKRKDLNQSTSSFGSRSTQLSVQGMKSHIYKSKDDAGPKPEGHDSSDESFTSGSDDELQFIEDSKLQSTKTSWAEKSRDHSDLTELFKARTNKSPVKGNQTKETQRPRTVHGYPRTSNQLNTQNTSYRPKTAMRLRTSPYGPISTAKTTPYIPPTRSSSASTNPIAPVNTPNGRRQAPQTDLNRSQKTKNQRNSIHPLGQAVSRKPSFMESGKLRKAPSSFKKPEKPKIRLKWYTVLQRTHYAKKIDSLYNKSNSMYDSHGNTCTEDELDLFKSKPKSPALTNKAKTASVFAKMTNHNEDTKRSRNDSFKESDPLKSKTERPLKMVTKTRDNQNQKDFLKDADTTKSHVTLNESKSQTTIEYDADLETDMETLNATNKTNKNTPMMNRRAKARQALSNALSRSNSKAKESIKLNLGSLSSDIPETPKILRSVRFKSPRSKRDSSRFRAEERKLQMYVDSSSSEEEDDETLQRMGTRQLSPYRGPSTPLPLKTTSWLSDSNSNLNKANEVPKKQASRDETSAPNRTHTASVNKGHESKPPRSMFERRDPSPDFGRVVHIQGCKEGTMLNFDPNKKKKDDIVSPPKYFADKNSQRNSKSPANNTTTLQPKPQVESHKQTNSSTGGLTYVESKSSWTPVLPRQSRKDTWSQSKPVKTTQHKTVETNSNDPAIRNDNTKPKIVTVQVKSKHNDSEKQQPGLPSNESNSARSRKSEVEFPKPSVSKGTPSSHKPVQSRSKSRDNKLTVNDVIFGSHHRRDKSNPRTNLVRSTGIYSNNYESKGCSSTSQAQGITLPKLVPEDGYNAFARTAPGNRNREFSPMNWSRNCTTEPANPKPSKQNQPYVWRTKSQERKPDSERGNSVFKQILQSMLQNTQDTPSNADTVQRAETAPANMRRRDPSVDTYFPAVVATTVPSNNLVECTKL